MNGRLTTKALKVLFKGTPWEAKVDEHLAKQEALIQDLTAPMPRQNIGIVPNGRATQSDHCSLCGRLPHHWEDPFMIYGKPLCEDCFWSDDWQEKVEADLKAQYGKGDKGTAQ